MKRTIPLTGLLVVLSTFFSYAQYEFPDCNDVYDQANAPFLAGDKVSLDGINYVAKNWINTPPPGEAWTSNGPCGDASDVLGEPFNKKRNVIGYMPTWQKSYDFSDYDPAKLTHVIVSFLDFKAVDIGDVYDNMDYTSNDFVSEIKFSEKSVNAVDSILNDDNTNLLSVSKAADTKVMVAVGGAIDYGFLWLMTRYYNNDQKITEIAQLMFDYVESRNIDGIDLDMECWWIDNNVNKSVDEGGRVRGSNFGAPDDGPHVAGIGITKLAKKIKELKPDIILSSVVFGTAWYGNNYDEAMADYLDWIGIFTYDFTGSWNDSPFGPHGALKKLPLDSYTHQTADNPIYSAEEVLEYWMGISLPAWNHDGGFNIERNKLCIGAPFYGYDFSTPKPNNGNGFEFEKYADIVAKYPAAPTSYDAKSPGAFNGHISEGGEDLYYETPMRIREKMKFLYNYGHQGIIIWELTTDLHPNDEHSLLNNVADENIKQCIKFGHGCVLSDDSVDELIDVKLYVNDNKLYYDLDNYPTSTPNLKIIDMMGREVISKKITSSKGNIALDIPAGIYVVTGNNFSKLIAVN